MKKILVFGITETPGGVESVIMNYYRYINKQKIQFDFLCNTETVAYEEEIKTLGGKIYKITSRRKNRKKFKKEMNAFFINNAKQYSAIWVNVCSLANIDYLKYAKKYGIKTRIIHAHNSQNMDSFLRGMLHRFNKLLISKYATDFWSCSDEASKWFYNKKIINSDKYLIIKNAIDVDKFKYNEDTRRKYRKELKIEDKFVIGNVGRLHFQKNQIFLIKIFKEIKEKLDNTVLLIVGEGEERKNIENTIKEYKLEDSVVLLGSRNDVNNLMQAMDVFVFPSLFEGLPLVAIEAQVSGLKTYASYKAIPKEACVDKEIFEFIELEKGEKYWSERILNDTSKTINRKRNLEIYQDAGYDIKSEINKFEELAIKK